MTILYADDDNDDHEIMSEALRQVDPSILCLEASDGGQVLEMLDTVTHLPDYIFLDINMPVMDGKACLVELKKNYRLRMIPVVIVSTTTDEKEINQLYSLGAFSFLKKPNRFSDLCNMLNTFIHSKENGFLREA